MPGKDSCRVSTVTSQATHYNIPPSFYIEDVAANWKNHETSGASFLFSKEAREYLEIHDPAPGPVPASQQNHKHKHRVKWAIKNKIKFTEVVTKLQEYNTKLDELLGSQEWSSFKSTLPGYILALINKAEDLKSIQVLAGPTDVLVAHAAKLKLLELTTWIGPSVNDPTNSLRLGLVLQPPAKYGMAQPTTLLQMIEGTTRNPSASREPPLGHKFAHARALASSPALLHAAKWQHKAFRSDTILFFGNPSNPDSLHQWT
ncbi:hypothetical protein B0T18DRAFT_428660 [Schizothecium vesticola]|uniref:Prion-inhibition and propagation HeLo domain-containing protein n=1 Tax=Schizothecium vesticola TaxID=314040 RepID=A0AA40K4E8_9PEZI|nr:hypothetical protein B0T18DRAFT_428660 [Schizothecium vesticola]